jgi:hypothetical protein
MFIKSQLLPHYPYVDLFLADGRKVELCEALSYRDARLYHVSHLNSEGFQILDNPQWFLDFKHVNGQTRSIEITESQALEISEACKVKVETFSDGIFWF